VDTLNQPATTTRRPSTDDRSPWLAVGRLWVVVVAFAAVAVFRSWQVGIPFRDPHGEFLRSRVTLTCAVFLGWVLVEAVVRAGRRPSPARVLASVRERWTRQRLGVAVAALAAYHATYFCYHNLKSWNSFNTVRDTMLMGWDRTLFLGHTPAVLLHDLLGKHVAAWFLTGWYESFGTLVILAFPAAVVLTRRVTDGVVSIAALAWTWILGTASYYAIPSLGPFHEDPAAFAGLSHTMVQDTQVRYMGQRADLLAHPHAPDAFAQVAAFASLHCGITAAILGIAWWNRWRRTRIVMTVFLAGTVVATVYLGWHFFVDDIVGVAIAAAAWWLGPRTVGVRRPEATR
jgi:hypothetical protein